MINVLAGIVGVCVNSIGSPALPLMPSIVSIMFQATVCGLPYRKLFFLVSTISYGIISYNFAGVVTGGKAGMALDGYREPTFMEVYFNCWVGYALVFLPIACSIMTVNHQAKMLATAEATNDLSATVAALLRAYDTEAVAEALKMHVEEFPDTDAELLASYDALVENLNRYRPHLPNWMVTMNDDEAVSSEGGSDRSSTRSRASKAASRRSSKISRVSGEKAVSTADARGSMTELPQVLAVKPTSATMCFALIEYTTPAGEQLNDFVDKVHVIAAQTHGAIHSFAGDTVQVSWNAAMRAVQPEVKAVRFFARLAAWVKDQPDEGVAACGAVMSGKATSVFAGTGKVQALSVSLPWRETLQAIFALAKQTRTFLAAGRTAASAADVCATRAVEYVAVEAAGKVVETEVHHVLSEKDAEADEWMYVVGKDSVDPVTKALHACVAGEYGEAMETLKELSDDARAAPLVPRLIARAEAALANPPASFAVVFSADI
jgi:hypothetical protein